MYSLLQSTENWQQHSESSRCHLRCIPYHTLKQCRHVDLTMLAMKHSVELKVAASESQRENLKDLAKQQFNALNEPVARMVRTVLTEVLTEILFLASCTASWLAAENGAEMGTLYGSRYGARKNLQTISKTMHRNLLLFLKDQDKPFSLVVDATTITMNIPYFICFFQAIEDNHPISYFYRRMELSEGEGSRA